MTERNSICIYHGNCADGFSGAWVVRRAHQEGGYGQGLSFHPGVYQTEPPDVTGKDVILVDFSYPRDVMEGIVERAESVLVLDHHKTAQEALTGLPKADVVFDMERAGSMIAWDYFFPGQEPPQLLKHIQDRDLWRFALPFTREIQANVFSHPYAFDTWDELMSANVAELAREGIAIERKHLKDINELVKVTRRRMVIGWVDVPVANLPYTMASDAAHQMSIGERFAACYYDVDGARVFSLRSQPEGMDVSEIARQYGGGGHKHAAGFRVPKLDLLRLGLD